MRSPRLDQLPPPPAGKTGWPWTEASAPMPQMMPDGRPWPKVSIVTPSFNQAQFIEETLRAVLLQGYPALEYYVMDGGSSDGSVDIIRRYAGWLTGWASEPDRGQTDAIVKGLRQSDGAICAWLNSDDVYLPDAVREASLQLSDHPSSAVVYGDADFVDAGGRVTGRFQVQRFAPPQMFFDHFIPQPAAFIRRAALDAAGGLDEALHFCMDYHLWLRIALVGELTYSPRVWALYRVHPASKGTTAQALRWSETASILSSFLARADVPPRWRRYRAEAVGRAHWRASIEFYRSQDRAQAAEHITAALELAGAFLNSREFAGCLIGGRARETTAEALPFVAGYFDLIPDGVTYKRRALVCASAYAEALIALNDATPRDSARTHARRALRQDQFWLANRHVVSRAFR